jgi:hypothetical protein
MPWSNVGSISVGPQDKEVSVGSFSMEPDDDTIWIRMTQTSPATKWNYSFGLLTWRTSFGQELGTVKVFGDTDSEVFLLGVGLPPLERDGVFIFTPRLYNRQWISVEVPPLWGLSFEAQSGKASDGPPVFGTRATLTVLADVAGEAFSYAIANGFARIIP